MNSTAVRESKQTLFFAIFALSGFSGLIYESIWTHYLKLFLGHAAYAQTLVLVIFMGGMALGAWVAGKFSHRISNLLVAYALVEAVIGVAAMVFQPVFVGATDWAYHSVIPGLSSPSSISIFKWTLSSALILPQSILLGSTFPLMSAGILRRFPDFPGQSLATLYFTNSIGAALGVLASGFWLIDAYGLPGTMLIAGVINILVALVMWSQSYKDQCSPIEENLDLSEPGSDTDRRKFLTLFLAIAFFTGAASFFYEIGWIRMLVLVLGASTHAFELMLSTFILGLAIGGYWIKRNIDTLENPIHTLAIVQLVMGALALSTLILYNQTFLWMSDVVLGLQKTEFGYLLFNLFSHGIAMIVMLPATICAGMTLPLITYLLFSNGYGEKSVGAIYSANTFGSIVGIVLSVQLVMPLLGLKSVIMVGSIVDVGLGLFLLWLVYDSANRLKFFAVAASLVYFIFTVGFKAEFNKYRMASGVFRHGSTMTQEVIFHKDGKTASVDIVKAGTALSIATNGKPDAQIEFGEEPGADEPTMMMVASIPLAIKGEGAKTIANVGLGSGLTVDTLLRSPLVQSVDTIEIEPAMLEGARYFKHRVEKTFTDPRSTIFIEDAKTFFTNNNKAYDMILSEPSNPWVSGVAGLFSKEFYAHTKRYLKKDGLFVQWIHLYEMDESLVVSIVKALSSEYADYKLYLTDNGDILMIASQEPVGEIQHDIFQYPEMKTVLNRIGVLSLDDLKARYLASKKLVDLTANMFEIPANSDYYPVLDQQAVKYRYFRQGALSIASLPFSPMDIESLLGEQKVRLGDELGRNHFMYVTDKVKIARNIYLAAEAVTKNMSYSINEPILSYQVMQGIKSLQDGYSHCDSAMFANKAWFPVVFDLAQRSMPYLDQAQARLVVDVIKKSACAAQLSEERKRWLSLFDFFVYEKMAELAATSESLLLEDVRDDFDGALDLDAVNYNYAYLKLLAMQANLKLANYDKVLEIHGNIKVEKTKLFFLIEAAAGIAQSFKSTGKGL